MSNYFFAILLYNPSRKKMSPTTKATPYKKGFFSRILFAKTNAKTLIRYKYIG